MRCEDYDYIELACMFRYPVRLSLRNGKVIEATASDTTRNMANQECMKMLRNNDEMVVILDDIAEMVVTVNNPHFSSIRFD